MKIIIAGCGKVGTTITEQLSAEGHDIAIIPNSEIINLSILSFISISFVTFHSCVRHSTLEFSACKTTIKPSFFQANGIDGCIMV